MLGLDILSGRNDGCNVITIRDQPSYREVCQSSNNQDLEFPIPKHSDGRSWSLVYSSPIFTANNTKIALIGEMEKYNPMSRNRISSVTFSPASMTTKVVIPCVSNKEETISLLWLLTTTSRPFSVDSEHLTQCQCQPTYDSLTLTASVSTGSELGLDYQCKYL